MSIAAFVDRHSVVIKREVWERQPNGENKLTAETTINANARCFVQPVSSREHLQFMKNGLTVTHVIYFASDPFGGVDANQHVVIWNGRNMEVVGFENQAGLGRLYRLLANSNTHEQPTNA